MARTKMAEATKRESQVMYIGPNMRELGRVNGRVYRGDCSIFFKPLKEKYSLIGVLLVPISEITAAKVRMSTKGSAEWLAVQQLTGGEM